MIFAFADLETRAPRLGLNGSIREVEPAVIRRDVVRVRPLVPAAAVAAPVAVPPPTPAPAARFEEPEEYERWDGMA